MKDTPWYMYGERTLSFSDRLRLLLGATLYVRFDSPNGDCNAACNFSHQISRCPVNKIVWPSRRIQEALQ
jgi:hypothetical protein